MRGSLVVLMAIGLAQPALAADAESPYLRGSQGFVVGSPSYPRWDGLYGGVQAGYSSAGVDFGNGVSSLVSYLLRNMAIENEVSSWTTLPKGDTSASSYGGFIGYNWQWDDAVLGVEVNYNRTSIGQSARDSIARSFQNDSGAPSGHHLFYDAAVSAAASIKVTDVATFRSRAGWAAGNFLPYGFLGIAVGRANVSRSATVAVQTTDIPDPQTPPAPPLTPLVFAPYNATTVGAQDGVFAYGFTAGLGVDVALLQNLFLRGEWEWVQFAPIKDVKVYSSTGRAAVGLKF